MTAMEREHAAKVAAPPVPGDVSRVMVVDDSAGHRAMLARLLGRWGYDVMQAANASEALAMIEAQPPDIVLSDWVMPGMTGPDLCRAFHARGQPGYAYFILLTSKSETSAVAAGLDAGADDFVSKPVNPEELRARINAGVRIVSMQRELCAKNRMISETLAALQEVHAEIDRDLQQARLIQQALVPDRVRRFGTSQVSLLMKPCGHIGGDLVGMFSPGTGHVGLYGLDVSGHGITSAMVTARVAGYFSPRYPEQNIALAPCSGNVYALRDVEDVARGLNERLLADPGVDEYLTLLYAAADLDSGKVRLVQAGHPAPLLIRANGESQFVGGGGVPVGLVEGVRHDRQDLTLNAGDRLLIYSDGFTEATGKSGRMLGEDGLRDMAIACRDSRGTEFLDEMFWHLTRSLPNGARPDDDVSAALLEYRCYPDDG